MENKKSDILDINKNRENSMTVMEMYRRKKKNKKLEIMIKDFNRALSLERSYKDPCIPRIDVDSLSFKLQNEVRDYKERKTKEQKNKEKRTNAYWWSDEIAELRRKYIKQRRIYTRARGKKNAKEEELARIKENLNAAKKTLKTAIRKVKEICLSESYKELSSLDALESLEMFFASIVTFCLDDFLQEEALEKEFISLKRAIRKIKELAKIASNEDLSLLNDFISIKKNSLRKKIFAYQLEVGEELRDPFSPEEINRLTERENSLLLPNFIANMKKLHYKNIEKRTLLDLELHHKRLMRYHRDAMIPMKR